MKAKLIQKPLSIKKSSVHGYGVYAECDIQKDEVIEECYTLLSDGKENILKNYYFLAGKRYGIPLGFGFIYNHADQPNATYSFDEENQLLIFKARCSIQKGEEIFISYGEYWFDHREMIVKKISSHKKVWRFLLGAPLRGLVVIGMIYLLIWACGRFLI